MIYLELFLGFLKVGLFAFGGGYGAIPLVRETVIAYGWLDDASLADLIAVSESTPGPIMVNMATYVGSTQGGLLGAIIATTAAVSPAFIIILLLMKLLKNALGNPVVQAAVDGLKPGIIGIILATGVYMSLKCIFPENTIDLKALGLGAVLAAFYFGAKKIKKLKNGISPIALIVIAGAAGVLLYGLH